MKTLILPIAGESSRYAGMPPKWSIRHPNGLSMLTESIRGINPGSFDRVVIMCLEEHLNDAVSIVGEIQAEYGVVVNIASTKKSSSQVETVALAIEYAKITGSIFIKDCDGYFRITKELKENGVCYMPLEHAGKINAGNKSYIKIGVHNTIGNIAEKKIISDKFCVGGYFFKDAKKFLGYYTLNKTSGLYISHIIYAMLLNEERFEAIPAFDFEDWGTKEDWMDYLRSIRELKTIVMDVDLTLCEKNLNKPYDELEPKKDVVKTLKKYRKKGFYIILHTGRNMKTYNCNLGQINANTAPTLIWWLGKHDIPYDELYYGKPWCGEKGFNVCDSTIRPDEFVTLTYEEIMKKLKRCRE